MQVSAIDHAGLPVLFLEGEVDLYQSPILRTELQAHVKARTPALALDLSGVPYIDSSGLATIVEYVRDAQAFGGKIALLGLSVRVKTIFDLVRLGEILPIVATRDDAHARLLSPSA
jgi:anti-sigma B factor antagonist